ncbi:MAG TPA: branched-chain amino acid ABC transporter permease [Burkholderiales bacterium]|jgi:branched-chain amino acid transport system permease protein
MGAILFDGVVQGLQLSLLAVGITLIYGLGGVLNLAHGQFAITGGVAAALLVSVGAHPLLAALGGVAAAGALGLALDRTLLLPAYRFRGEERLLLGLILTLGFSFVVDGFLNWKFPEFSLTFRLPVPMVEIAGIPMRTASLAASAIALAIFAALFAFLKLTLTGKSIRSIIENETGAELCGIDPSRTRTLIVCLAAAMAGVAGVTQGLFASLGTEMGPEFTTLGLLVAVVGGVRSINGTLAAGIALGVVNALASHYVGAYVAYIILLSFAMATILVRPAGLLARFT